MHKRPSKTKSANTLQPGNIIARTVLALLFCLGFFLSGLPLGRAVAQTALLLPSIISASEPAPLSLIGEPVRHTQSTIQSSNGPVYLDIYAPATPSPLISGVREGVVVVPGVGDERKDQQLINFSQALAGVGIVVLNITTPTLIQYDLAPKDGDAVVQAFKTLARWPGLSVDHIGIIGFSGGGALACLGAADPRIRASVASLTLFGSYFNAFSLLHDFGRRALNTNGHSQPWHPQEVSIQVMTSIIAGQLPPNESALLTSSLDPGGSPLSAFEQQKLSPSAQAAYHLLQGDEPNKVNANIAALTPQISTLLQQLSPSSVINQIRAPIYLLHDRNDQYVPFTQSRDFAQALTNAHHAHDFAEFGIFQHVEVRPDLGLSQTLGDGSNLFRILAEMFLAYS